MGRSPAAQMILLPLWHALWRLGTLLHFYRLEEAHGVSGTLPNKEEEEEEEFKATLPIKS